MWLPKISKDVIQLERTPTYHLMVPITAFEGHDQAKILTRVPEDGADSWLIRACAQMQEPQPAPEASLAE